MALRHRLLTVSCLLLILSYPAGTQNASTTAGSPPDQSIESLLASGQPRLVAWGAHEALVAQRRDLIPDLLSLAAQWQALPPPDPDKWRAEDDLPQDQLDERDAMAAVLDSLIQMNASVPADMLGTLAPDFGNDVAVLLSRMPTPDAVRLALQFYHSLPAHAYALRYVSAAMLALHPPPGFAADLLSNTTIYAWLFIIRPGSESIGFAHGEGDCFSPGPGALRKDWPLTGQYMLHRDYVPNDKKYIAMLLVGGIDPIYATREEFTRYRAETCGTSLGVSLGSKESRRLLAEMLGIAPEAIPWQVEIQTHIEFRSLQQFYRDLLAFVAAEQAKYRMTVADLVAHNLMTELEAEQSLPTLKLWVRDKRGDIAPVPAPSNLPAHVVWAAGDF